jgi:hypothetical protein
MNESLCDSNADRDNYIHLWIKLSAALYIRIVFLQPGIAIEASVPEKIYRVSINYSPHFKLS